MMPTLAAGDHMLVSRFAYVLGELERGDVIVFRYPVDPSQRFFKRVIGLPGDQVEVTGRQVSIVRAGTDELEVLQREPLEQPCTDLDGTPVAKCTLYEETVDGNRYVVGYRTNTEERQGQEPPIQVWKVPEGHLFVLGDNRNDSLDSRRWVVPVEAVVADALLSTKDLRELTDQRLFSMDRPMNFDEPPDYSHDHVSFWARFDDEGVRRPTAQHQLVLEVWWRPEVGVSTLVETLLAEWGVAETAEAAPELPGGLVVEDDSASLIVIPVPESQTVLRLWCGRGLCPTREVFLGLAQRAAGRATDPQGFVDPSAQRPLPFVPLDYVEGRVEWIWWPPSRWQVVQ